MVQANVTAAVTFPIGGVTDAALNEFLDRGRLSRNMPEATGLTAHRQPRQREDAR
jgi:hypothetical protein